jgi:murein DD-endopeptidase MepM/ murein hydrolase activator NlpD
MDPSEVDRYKHLRNYEVYLIMLLVLSLCSSPACFPQKTLIPAESLSKLDISDPKIADGFDYPIENYYTTMVTRFLESEKACFGCPRFYHSGVDVGMSRRDAPVCTIANGIVIFADFEDVFTGYVVVIEHISPHGINFKLPGGEETDIVWSAYLHMSRIDNNNVALNKVVARGTRIGFIGDFPYGSQEDYHLHFEIRKENIWAGSAYDEEFNSCWMQPKDYVASKFVDPSKFIRLNRPN